MLFPVVRPSLGLSLAVVLHALVLHAEPDAFGTGDGHTGALTVTAPGTVVNQYTTLAADVASGVASVTVVDVRAFGAGDLVMAWEPAGMEPSLAPSGAAGPIDLASTSVGAWEFARVVGVSGHTLMLARAWVRGFSSRSTQLVRVPEYSDLTVMPGASVHAVPWNGGLGGIVAFLARGTVTVDGAIDASGAGFRGGVFVNEPVYNHNGCTELDATAPGTDGGKGEGVVSAAFGPTSNARGNVANGGGGGDCKNSGGAGGGNAGAGGAGGYSYMDGDRPVGGMPAAALQYSLLGRVTFGGGGGAAHGNDRAAEDGGVGGGVILLRAHAVAGSGTIQADGAMGVFPNQYGLGPGHDGQSGGGAGGSILVRVETTLACGGVSARGANGIDAPVDAHGPGGGGGGGRVLLQASTVACPMDVRAGIAGVQTLATASGGPHYGATPSVGTDPQSIGLVESPPAGGLPTVAPPVIVSPQDGTTVEPGDVSIRGMAVAGERVLVGWQDAWMPAVDVAADGTFVVVVPGVGVGSYHARAVALSQGLSSAPVIVQVTVACRHAGCVVDGGAPDGSLPTIGGGPSCRCSAPGGGVAEGGFLALGISALLARRRRRLAV